MSFASVGYYGCRYIYRGTYTCSGYEQQLSHCSTAADSYGGGAWYMHGVDCGTGKTTYIHLR